MNPFSPKYIEGRSIPEPNSGCWLWLLSVNELGYGQATARKAGQKWIFAHRYSYLAYIGMIPEGLYVLHKCDQPGCVNPEHLFLGTKNDNNKDRAAKGRSHRPMGELNWNCKIKEYDVTIIRADNRVAGIIAKEYNISPRTIYEIKSKKTWRHV